MGLKQELIRNVKRTGLNAEDEKSLIQEIEEIWAFEDSLEEDAGTSRKRVKSARGKRAEHPPK
ncbi:MAG: hypothetical protein ABSF48_13380 [Thermodesulfobacteriota bacterium]|jgi:hypothetical protein